MALFKKKEEREATFFWKRFERGRDYVYRKNLVTKTQRNWNFYIGNQWEGIESGNEMLPKYPFIEGVVNHKVSTVSQNNMVAKFSDLEGREDMNDVYEKFNQLFSTCWEKANQDMELWNTIKDSAVTGEGIQYYGSSDVSEFERIQNTAIFYGDENEPKIQKQPYIILWQRRKVSDVRAEAELNGIDKAQIELILPDDETMDVVGNKDELDRTQNVGDSKVTCIIHMEKKGGIVHVAKSTKHVVYEPEHSISVTMPDGSEGKGLSLYPVVKMNWKDFPNTARGVSEVEQMIPNQLEVNKTLARISQVNKNMAFPRMAYDGNAIANPEDLDKVGVPIEITTGGVQSINQMIAYLNPAQSSGDAKNFADDLLNMTQELAGAGETARGNIELNRVAASAVLAVRDQAALPLNIQVAKKQTFVEDLAMLWLELWAVFHPDGMDVTIEREDPATGMKQKIPSRITKEDIDALKPDIRIDVSNDNPWTKEAEQTWADNALGNQHITFEEYVEIAPEHGIVPKAKLEVIFQRRQAQMQMQQQQEQMIREQEMQNIAEADARGELEDPNYIPQEA